MSSSQDNSVQLLSNKQDNSRQILSNNQNNSRKILSDSRESLEQKMSKSPESYKTINNNHTIKSYQTSVPFFSKEKDNFQPILSLKKDSPEQVVPTTKDSSGKNVSAKKDNSGQIWASMGLCYNKNVQEMGKGKFFKLKYLFLFLENSFALQKINNILVLCESLCFVFG